MRDAPAAVGLALPHDQVFAPERRPDLPVLHHRALIIPPVVGQISRDVQFDRLRLVACDDAAFG